MIDKSIKKELILNSTWEENKAKLTVAIDRISIKLSKNTSKKIQEEQKNFFMKIANDLFVTHKIKNTYRGRMSIKDNEYVIVLYDNSRKNNYRYTYLRTIQ